MMHALPIITPRTASATRSLLRRNDSRAMAITAFAWRRASSSNHGCGSRSSVACLSGSICCLYSIHLYAFAYVREKLQHQELQLLMSTEPDRAHMKRVAQACRTVKANKLVDDSNTKRKCR